LNDRFGAQARRYRSISIRRTWRPRLCAHFSTCFNVTIKRSLLIKKLQGKVSIVGETHLPALILDNDGTDFDYPSDISSHIAKHSNNLLCLIHDLRQLHLVPNLLLCHQQPGCVKFHGLFDETFVFDQPANTLALLESQLMVLLAQVSRCIEHLLPVDIHFLEFAGHTLHLPLHLNFELLHIFCTKTVELANLLMHPVCGCIDCTRR
jgi:hypothetical protein